jgi:hypothetical protein
VPFPPELVDASATEGGHAVKSNVRALDLHDLRARLAAFEDRYATPSPRLHEAFTVNGVLRFMYGF